jgi:hypothetical protein
MKFRIYKLSGNLSYKDVEAETETDAKRHIINPVNSAPITQSEGLLLEYIITQEVSNVWTHAHALRMQHIKNQR